MDSWATEIVVFGNCDLVGRLHLFDILMLLLLHAADPWATEMLVSGDHYLTAVSLAYSVTRHTVVADTTTK